MNYKGPKGILGAILIIVVLVLAYKQAIKKQEMKSWPQASGVIVYSYIDDWKRHDTTSVNEIKIRKEVVEYSVKLEYEFEVDGVLFTGNKLGYGSTRTRSLKSAESILDRYPAGAKVTVYFNPADPSDNVLNR